MVRRCLALAAVAGLSAAASIASSQANDSAVVELFTSQGCSSCPPADELLGRLAKEPNLIAISLPIDVWDYLGWRDTLADPRNTARWKSYSKARGDRQVYTPQAVVNGAAHAVGSDRGAIDKAIVKSRQNPAVMSVPVKLSVDGHDTSLTVGGSGSPIAAGAEVFVAGLAKAVTVAIGRGENKGRTVTYYNVVRSWERFEPFKGAPGSWQLGPLKRDGVDAVAVFVQAGDEGMPGPILGAAIAPLH